MKSHLLEAESRLEMVRYLCRNKEIKSHLAERFREYNTAPELVLNRLEDAKKGIDNWMSVRSDMCHVLQIKPEVYDKFILATKAKME